MPSHVANPLAIRAISSSAHRRLGLPRTYGNPSEYDETRRGDGQVSVEDDDLEAEARAYFAENNIDVNRRPFFIGLNPHPDLGPFYPVKTFEGVSLVSHFVT